jgi:hypothetical protein
MSVKNGKVCCNCRHCIRNQDKKYNIVVCRCEVFDRYLSYAEVLTSCCKRWAKEKEGE